MSATMTVERSYEQRMDALGHANDIRVRRGGFKAALRSGEIRLADVIREPEWFVFSVPMFELLGWAPRVGRDRVNRVLRRADVWPLRTVGALTMRQRERVLVELAAVMGAGG